MTNSPLVQYITNKQSGTSRMTTTKAYDSLNRLTVISSVNSLTTVDAHNYGYNNANQRTAVTNADGTYWQYQYDSLGQVTSGIKHWSDGSVVAGQQFGYGFDDIGNRQTTSAGGDQWGANLRYASYTANNLNQYTSRTVPGAVDVIGSATNTATVTVNNQPTYRRGNYFRAQLSLNNLSSPVWQQVTNLAVLNEGTTDVRLSAQTNNLFLPKTPETFAYDADGNLTNDGRWAYTWDAENRLTSMTNITSVPTGAQMRIDFGYDHKSRRTSKNVVISGVTNFQKFVYDAWNEQATLNSTFAALNTFMWGSDLSGSMQGAGGVGGLLKTSSGSTNCFVAFDGNGNVSALVNAADGTVLANYEYGPFGELIRATGPMAKANPFRFSTKYQDDESDLLYYGRRYLNTSTGRWLSKDPIKEKGGLNLYGFTGNVPISRIDKLELTDADGSHTSTDQHNNYLIFHISCPKGFKIGTVWVQHDDDAFYQGLYQEWIDENPEVEAYTTEASYAQLVQQNLDNDLGTIDSFYTPQLNCDGTPVEERVWMRTRLVTDSLGAEGLRILDSLPDDIAGTLSLYLEYTHLYHTCVECCRGKR